MSLPCNLWLRSLFFSFFLYLPQYIIYKKVIGFDTPESDLKQLSNKFLSKLEAPLKTTVICSRFLICKKNKRKK